MTSVRLLCAAVITVVVASAHAQDHGIAKPPAEMANLKKLEGTWETLTKGMGPDEKGTCVIKIDLGGQYLTHTFQSQSGFTGRGFDTFDADKKVYVSYWFDSMSNQALRFEGTFDEAKKIRTMIAEGMGHDGAKTKYKSVTQMPDDNTINFAMFMGDMKEPGLTVVYKRKK